MLADRRLTPFARAVRLFSVSICFIFITSIVLVGCSRGFLKRRRRTGVSLSMSKIALLETSKLQPAVHLARTGGSEHTHATKSDAVNVEKTNITVVLENVEVDNQGTRAPWMFTYSNSPFVQVENVSTAVYANTKLSWNPDGRGDGTCSSGGSGKPSQGYLDPFNYFLGLQSPPDFKNVQVELRNLSLSDFRHINTVTQGGAWNTMGQAGDTRRYGHGTFKIFTNETVLLSSKNVQWVQNISYPAPIGESRSGAFSVGGYFVAEIQELKSDEEWVKRLDPRGVGYVLGVVTAVSFGPTACLTSNSYWVSLRGFPDFESGVSESAAGALASGAKPGGAKVGIYKGSSDSHMAAARALAGTAKGVVVTVVGVVLGSALSSAAAAALAPAASSGPPGQGLAKLLGTAAFVAKVNEIHGFHSDAMTEFGDGLKIFIGKVEWPWSNKTASSGVAFQVANRLFANGRQMENHSLASLPNDSNRQEAESNASISDELFGGCAFYTTLIVVGFLLLHGCIWLLTRKKPLEEQLVPHAWMIYIFSIAMSHVYTAAVLNSMQYMRSHVGNGTGKPGLYLVAVLQLLLIGVGFTAFFMTIMVLALKRVRRSDVKWIPRHEIPDPDLRRSTVITGEYKADDNAFHTLFECYYTSLAAPRLWLAALELSIVFVDAICTAVIWDEKVCLGILVCMYAFLFALFLVLAPFVDRIEGGLVRVLGVVELVLLVMEFFGALGDFDTAENMEFGALILGFIAIGLAVIIAIYCDLIPIASSLWSSLRRRFRKEEVADGRECRQALSDVDSDWSGISRSASEATGSVDLSEHSSDSIERETMQVDSLVAHNAEREQEVPRMLSSIFAPENATRLSAAVDVQTANRNSETEVDEIEREAMDSGEDMMEAAGDKGSDSCSPDGSCDGARRGRRDENGEV